MLEKYIVYNVCGLRSPSFESSNVLYMTPSYTFSMQKLMRLICRNVLNPIAYIKVYTLKPEWLPQSELIAWQLNLGLYMKYIPWDFYKSVFIGTVWDYQDISSFIIFGITKILFTWVTNLYSGGCHRSLSNIIAIQRILRMFYRSKPVSNAEVNERGLGTLRWAHFLYMTKQIICVHV